MSEQKRAFMVEKTVRLDLPERPSHIKLRKNRLQAQHISATIKVTTEAQKKGSLSPFRISDHT